MDTTNKMNNLLNETNQCNNQTSRRGFLTGSILACVGTGLLANSSLAAGALPESSGNAGIWYFEDFGAAGDFYLENGAVNPNPTDDTAAIIAALEALPEGTRIYGKPNACYWFGELSLNASHIVLSKNVHIDWQGAGLKCRMQYSSESNSTALFEFLDCSGSFLNYIFEDVSYEAEGTSRGVIPLFIKNVNKHTNNYNIGPFHVISGQSLLTCHSSNPENARACDISFIGSCTGDNVYYGVNLGYNGDRFSGSYSVNKVRRLAFLYGVDTVRIVAHAQMCLPSSGNIMLSGGHNPDVAAKLNNIAIKASIGELNGPIRFYRGSGTSGKFENVDLDINIDQVGPNLERDEALIVLDDSSGSIPAEGMTVDQLNVAISNKGEGRVPIKQLARSDNMGVINIQDVPYFNAEQFLPDFIIQNGRNSFTKGFVGDVSTELTALRLSHMLLKNTPAIIRAYVTVAVSEGADFYGQNTAIAKYALHGFMTSNHFFNIQSLKLIEVSVTGTKTPAITIAAQNKDISANTESTESTDSSEQPKSDKTQDYVGTLVCGAIGYESNNRGSMQVTLELL
ncbi:MULTISPECIES: hypothetical protein [unclassified Pseudoalteromonas]|uniref:hypothetical protein n=1 Tax=unclassified Pseudoalteromonas TaxID=194690 RepID=UPI00209782D1|nr:hypothetical protein [Pseudoalteromonas sp. XMcav2-N]MCO7189634.1 hypothetical protein [Pseudoalteromonas sp. XMcav2-N]